MIKRIIAILIISTIFASCIKNLDEEGIFDTTTCVGTLVDNQSNKPIAGMRVSKINDTDIPHTIKTDNEGNFSISVTIDEAHKGYYLVFDADSLYSKMVWTLEEFPFGCQYYNIGVVEIQGPTPPTLETIDTTEVTSNSAILGGKLKHNGNLSVTACGVCYGTQPEPKATGAHISMEMDKNGNFSGMLYGLNLNTKYYARAYATNRLGTSYGNEISFTTKDGLPKVRTIEPEVKSATAAISGGNITDDSGYQIISYGVCWSVTEQPTIQSPHTIDGSGMGTFESNILGLDVLTTYYVRAYATSSAGTAYGEQYIFKTTDGLPILTTVNPDTLQITPTMAVLGGCVVSDGGFTCFTRGVCYSTSPNPTISDQHTTDGSGEGDFVSYLLNLTPQSTYYVRSYATNIMGTQYGNEVKFVARQYDSEKTNE